MARRGRHGADPVVGGVRAAVVGARAGLSAPAVAHLARPAGHGHTLIPKISAGAEPRVGRIGLDAGMVPSHAGEGGCQRGELKVVKLFPRELGDAGCAAADGDALSKAMVSQVIEHFTAFSVSKYRCLR